MKLKKLPSSDKIGSTGTSKVADKKSVLHMRREKSLKSIEKQAREDASVPLSQPPKNYSRINSATNEQTRRLKEKSGIISKETGSNSQNNTASGPSMLSLQATTINSSICNNKKSLKDKSLEDGLLITSPKSISEKLVSRGIVESKDEQNTKSKSQIEEKVGDQARSMSEKPKKLERVIADALNVNKEAESSSKEILEDSARKKSQYILSEKQIKRPSKTGSKCEKTPDSSFLAGQKTLAVKQLDSRTDSR